MPANSHVCVSMYSTCLYSFIYGCSTSKQFYSCVPMACTDLLRFESKAYQTPWLDTPTTLQIGVIKELLFGLGGCPHLYKDSANDLGRRPVRLNLCTRLIGTVIANSQNYKYALRSWGFFSKSAGFLNICWKNFPGRRICCGHLDLVNWELGALSLDAKY